VSNSLLSNETFAASTVVTTSPAVPAALVVPALDWIR